MNGKPNPSSPDPSVADTGGAASPVDAAPKNKRIALVFSGFGGGGLERSMLRTAAGLRARGYDIDLVVLEAEGDLRDEVPAGARVVELDKAPLWRVRAQLLSADAGLLRYAVKKKTPNRMRCLPSLVRHFSKSPPDAIFAAGPRYNLMAVWAKRLARLPARVIVSKRDQASDPMLEPNMLRGRYPATLIGRTYQQADVIVAVSNGVADDLAEAAGIPRDRITTVYNPVVGPDVHAKAREPLDHPWFAAGEPPVILGVGRLHQQKNFPMLIKAFARVRAKRPARLVILGGSDPGGGHEAYEANLRALPAKMGVADDVDFAGFVANPYAYMARATVFALSSNNEGLPGVLIQAMACGCPVVSTDCVSGPCEILDGGRFGPLVPVGDAIEFAKGIEWALDDPLPSDQLRARADLYTVERAVNRYIELMFGPGAR
jgi:glycosyltransferase involved in cell wall biosynthesis